MSCGPARLALGSVRAWPQGVTQQIVSVATARPKDFVSGVGHFLVIATPVEVSLHSLRTASGSDQFPPPLRTRHAVATDDVASTCDAQN